MRITLSLMAAVLIVCGVVRAGDESDSLSARWDDYWKRSASEEQERARRMELGFGLRAGTATDAVGESYGGAFWFEYRRWLPLVPYAAVSVDWMKAKWQVMPTGWFTSLAAELGWLLRFQTGRAAPYGGIGIGVLHVTKPTNDPAEGEPAPYDRKSRSQNYDLGTDFPTAVLHLGFDMRISGHISVWLDYAHRWARPSIEVTYQNLFTNATWTQQEQYDMNSMAVLLGVRSSL